MGQHTKRKQKGEANEGEHGVKSVQKTKGEVGQRRDVKSKIRPGAGDGL